jgi:hypothetical protein
MWRIELQLAENMDIGPFDFPKKRRLPAIARSPMDAMGWRHGCTFSVSKNPELRRALLGMKRRQSRWS